MICFCFSIGRYIDEKKIVKKIYFVLASAIIICSLFMCNTTSAAVGLIAVLLYIIIYCIKKKKIVKLITTIIIVISTLVLTTNMGKTKVIKDLEKTAQETVEITKGNVSEKFGSSRIYIWKNAIQLIPKYLIIGAGIDNFYYAFSGGPLLSENGKIFFDKAHNEYLQILITEGIFGLAAYLMLYLTIIKKGIKNSFKNEIICFILPIGGYLIQAFFNISVIEVAPIFYITIGLCSIDKE